MNIFCTEIFVCTTNVGGGAPALSIFGAEKKEKKTACVETYDAVERMHACRQPNGRTGGPNTIFTEQWKADGYKDTLFPFLKALLRLRVPQSTTRVSLVKRTTETRVHNGIDPKRLQAKPPGGATARWVDCASPWSCGWRRMAVVRTEAHLPVARILLSHRIGLQTEAQINACQICQICQRDLHSGTGTSEACIYITYLSIHLPWTGPTLCERRGRALVDSTCICIQSNEAKGYWGDERNRLVSSGHIYIYI